MPPHDCNDSSSSELVFRHATATTNHKPQRREGLAAGAKVSLWTALPFPRLLLLFPDRVHTPRNTSAISL